MLDRQQFLLALAVGACALPLRAQTTGRAIHRVEIRGFAFKPSRIEVRAGDIVEWINRDFAPHTATADNDNRCDTGFLKNEATGRWMPTQPGEFAYHCAFHPRMKGVIIVVAQIQDEPADSIWHVNERRLICSCLAAGAASAGGFRAMTEHAPFL